MKGSDQSGRKLVRQQTPPKVHQPVIEDYGRYEPPVHQMSHDSLNYPTQSKKSEPKQEEDPVYFQEIPAAL